MSKQAFELLDLESGYKYTLETSTDILPSDFNLVLPDRNGTLALTKDVDDLSSKLVRGDIVVGDSKKLDGKSLSEIALSDMSNVTLTQEMIASLRGFTGSTGSSGSTGPIGLQGYTGSVGFTGSKGSDGVAGVTGPIGPQGYTGSKGTDGINGYTGSQGVNGTNGFTGSTGSQGITGYTGSKGDTGQGFRISATFNSLSELLAGTTTNDTFALVAGTLNQEHEDYGKLYHRFNNTWIYITDMSIKGAAGIQGPQGNAGYTGSKGADGVNGYTGSKGADGVNGYTGSQGYTGSKGADGSSLEMILDCYSIDSVISLDLSRTSSFATQINPGDNVVIKPVNVTSYIYDSSSMMDAYTALSYVLVVKNGGQGIITWTSTSGAPVKWSNGIAPVLTTTGKDILAFISVDGGINWDGVVLSKDSK